MKLSRRDFIRVTALTVAGSAALGNSMFKPFDAGSTGRVSRMRKIPTICRMCFWKCGAIATVVDGVVVKLEGNPRHPNSRGRLCARGSAGMGVIYDKDRLKTPMIRTGARGEGRFRKASWDEALDYTAEKMLKIKEVYGTEALALMVHESSSPHFREFFSAFGSPNYAFPSYAQCRGPRREGFKLTFGEDPGSVERVDLANSRVIALFGTHIGENVHNSQAQDFAEAVGKGAKIIVVDPRYSTAAGKSNYWLPIKPGTDLALILTWINILIQEGTYDREYIEKYAIGLDGLKSEVKKYTPEWASKVTDLPVSMIMEPIRELARYSPNVCVHPGRHHSWYGDDVQRTRAMAILAALLGTWGRRGGIYLKTKAKVKTKHPEELIEGKFHPDPERDSLAYGDYPYSAPLTNEIRKATITGKPYPVKGWFIVAANLLKSIPNSGETIEAMKNLDLIVACDVIPSDTTMLADVILPECTYLERHDDIAKIKAYGMGGIAIRQPVVKPMYESREAWWIVKELAKKMNMDEYFPWGTYEERLRSQCRSWGVSFEELSREGCILIPDKASPYISDGRQPTFNTSSGKIELYSEDLRDEGFDPVPKYRPVEEPPDSFSRLIYGRSPVHTFSQTQNNQLLYELKKENEVWINKEIAIAMGLKNGEYVSLVNQDGVKSNRVRVKVTVRIRGDCLYLVHGFGATSEGLQNAYLKGADDNQLITRYSVDPLCGSTGLRGNFVKIMREV